MPVMSFMRYELQDSILNEIQSQGRQSIEWNEFSLLLLYVYMLFPCMLYSPLILSSSALLKKSALNLYYFFYIQSLPVRSNILSLQLSILLPTVGSIYNFQHIFQGMTSFVR